MSEGVSTQARVFLPALLALSLAFGCKDSTQASPEPGAEPAPPSLAKLQGEPAKHPAPQQVETKTDGPAPEAAPEPEEEAESSEGDDAESQPRRRAERDKKSARNRATSQPVEEAGAAGAAEMSVKRILFSRAIEGREPVSPEDTFEQGEADRLYAFVEIKNNSKQKSKVIVTFVPPQGKSSKVTLDVGDKPRWRTWALRKNATAPGTWKVYVRDEGGKLLGSRSFEVSP